MPTTYLNDALLSRSACDQYFAALAGDNSAWRTAFRESFLRAMKEELTPRQYEALWRHCVDGQAQNEIARDWGVSPSAVCRHLSRGRRRLRRLLAYNLDFQQSVS